MKNKILYILCIGFLSTIYFSLDIYSQRLSISSSYEIPIGFKQHVYNNAIGFNAEYSQVSTNTTFDAGIGFLSFKPKADSLYYLIGLDDFGIARYSNYSIFELYLGSSYIIDFNSDVVELIVGANIGYYYVKYEYSAFGSGESNLEGKGALVPKAKLNFNLSEGFGVFLESKFNCYFSLGSSNPSDINYNSNLGQFDFHVSSGVGLFKNF